MSSGFSVVNFYSLSPSCSVGEQSTSLRECGGRRSSDTSSFAVRSAAGEKVKLRAKDFLLPASIILMFNKKRENF